MTKVQRPSEPNQVPWPPAQLTRSHEARIAAGVCAGLARRTEVDPVIYRVAFAVLGCFGAGLLLYAAAWLLLPWEHTDASPAQRFFRRRIDGPAVLALVLALLTTAVLLMSPRTGPTTLAVVVVVTAATLAAHARGADLAAGVRSIPGRLRFPRVNDDPPPSPAPERAHPARQATPPPSETAPFGPPPGYAPHPAEAQFPAGTPGGAELPARTGEEVDLSLFGDAPLVGYAGTGAPDREDGRSGAWLSTVTLSTSLLAAATVATLGALGVVSPAPQLVLAVMTVMIGAGLLAGTWLGHGRPLIVAGLVTSLLLTGSAAVPSMDWGLPEGSSGLGLTDGMGERTWVPRTRVEHPFELTMGEATLELTELPAGKDYTFTAEVTVGELRVRVPKNAKVIIHARSMFGSVKIDGREVSAGRDATFTERLAGSNRKTRTSIELYLRNGVGEVGVNRVPPQT